MMLEMIPVHNCWPKFEDEHRFKAIEQRLTGLTPMEEA